jgi:adenylosuccinate lyase
MIDRYSHPTVGQAFAPSRIYNDWLNIEFSTLRVQVEQRVIPHEGMVELLAVLNTLQVQPPHDVAAIQAFEQQTHHDVAAFLWWLRERVPNGQWIHFGLTSSDIVDTALGIQFERLHRPMLMSLGDLTSAMTRHSLNDQPMLGLTHGQPAEPTSMRARAWHWLALVSTAMVSLSKACHSTQVCKLSGPVGTFAHNPPSVEAEVARQLGLQPMGPGASQIVPRTSLALWASSVAVLLGCYSKIATDLRLLAAREEVFWPRAKGHVGSSAMAHKNNPVEAEQMAGFARIAQGYATMLQPMDLWLEHDISHSSVERVAVPDLWHLLFTATERMTGLLSTMELRPLVIEENLASRSNQAWTHKVTLDAIRDGMGINEAREYALEFDTETYDVIGDAKQFMANYPEYKQ